MVELLGEVPHRVFAALADVLQYLFHDLARRIGVLLS